MAQRPAEAASRRDSALWLGSEEVGVQDGGEGQGMEEVGLGGLKGSWNGSVRPEGKEG